MWLSFTVMLRTTSCSTLTSQNKHQSHLSSSLRRKAWIEKCLFLLGFLKSNRCYIFKKIKKGQGIQVAVLQ